MTLRHGPIPEAVPIRYKEKSYLETETDLRHNWLGFHVPVHSEEPTKAHASGKIDEGIGFDYPISFSVLRHFAEDF